MESELKQQQQQLQPYNTQEVLDYLNSNFAKYTQQAKEDKEGEHVKIYRSLESSSQWTTKMSSSSSTSSQGSGKYGVKDVIRNKSNSNTLDLLFEINRSIYQQNKDNTGGHQQSTR